MAAIFTRISRNCWGCFCHSSKPVNRKTKNLWSYKALMQRRFLDIEMGDEPYICGDSSGEVEAAWRKKIAHTALYGDAIFVLGPMGVGKTTIINEEFKNHSLYKRYAFVDTDEIMADIPGFNLSKVKKYYPIARKIAINLTDWIMEERLSFIAEGTCVKYEELIAYMERLKVHGYSIKVRRIPHYPLDEVLKRARLRARRLPDEVVSEIYEGSLIGLDKLLQHNKNGLLFQEIKGNCKDEGMKDEAMGRDLKEAVVNQSEVIS